MPLALSPNRRFPIVLPGDADAPDPKPTFYARYQTADQVDDLITRFAEAQASKTHRELREAMNALLSEKIVAVEHIEADPSRLSGVLTEGEMQDLVYGIIEGSSLSDRDKKKSESALRSPTGESAPTVKQPESA